MKRLKNAHILTMSGGEYPHGSILFDEKIRYVGPEQEPGCQLEEDIDAGGAYALPGLIDAHCHVGMFEDSLGFEGDDGNEDSDPVTPQMRAVDAINPFDRCFADARRAGVTTVVTGPGSANAISGQFAAVKTAGICVDDMVLKAPAAMKFALGENPKSVYNAKNQTPMTRMGTMALIREALYKAAEYKEAWENYNANPEDFDKPDFDMKCAALLPVLDGSLPVKIHAHRADDICSALRLAKEFHLDVTIEHCSDGIAVLPVLARENVPVMLGPTLSDRSKPELKNLSFATYKALSEAGIDVAIITDHPEIPIEHLGLCCAMAVKHGMEPALALKAVTATAAKNCRIDGRVGTLDVGKDADIVLFDKLPTEFGASAMMTIINGDVVYNAEGK